MKIEGRVRKSLNGAIYALFAFALGLHILLFIYESKVLTDVTQNIVVKQVLNVSNIAAKNGDFLSLQMYMASVLEPVAGNLDVDIKLISLIDGRTMVAVNPSESPFLGFYKRNMNVDFEVNPIGSMRLEMELDMSKIIYISLAKTLFSLLILIFGVFAFRKYLNSKNAKNLYPIDEFSDFVEGISVEDFYKNEMVLPKSLSSDDLSLGFRRLFNTIRSISKDFAEIESSKRSLDIAKRVAHDIRSPLSVLNALSHHSDRVSESERSQILQQVSSRINGIAEDLLSDIRSSSEIDRAAKIVIDDSCKLLVEIEKIISEKEIESGDRHGVKIILRNNFASDFVGLVKFPALELSRIVSNLLNNAIEASKAGDVVIVDLSKANESLIVKIADFGAGIPDDVLLRLKKESLSTKSDGSGIGIYSANKSLERFGHKLDIQSKINIGTQVTIRFISL